MSARKRRDSSKGGPDSSAGGSSHREKIKTAKQKQRRKSHITDDTSGDPSQSGGSVSAHTRDDARVPMDDMSSLVGDHEEKTMALTALERDRMTREREELERKINDLALSMKEVAESSDGALSEQYSALRREQMGYEYESERLRRRLNGDYTPMQRERASSTSVSTEDSYGEQVLTRIKQREPYWARIEAELYHDYGDKLDELVTAMASEVENGNWVMVREKHGNAAGFAVTRMIIQRSEQRGTLFLEAPYGFKGKPDQNDGLRKWAKIFGQENMNDVLDMAEAYGWNVVPVDALSENGSGNDKTALKESGLPGSDNPRQLGLDVNGVLRQNYIARNMHEVMKGQKIGGMFIVGGAHITGATNYGVPPISNMVSTTRYRKENTHRLGDDTYTQVIDNNTVRETVTYSTQINKKPKKKSYPLDDRQKKAIKTALELRTISPQQLVKTYRTDIDTIKKIVREANLGHLYPELEQ